MWPRLRSWHQDQHCMRGQQPVSPEAWPEPPGIQCVGARGISRELPSSAALTAPSSPSLPSFSLPTFSLLT